MFYKIRVLHFDLSYALRARIKTFIAYFVKCNIGKNFYQGIFNKLPNIVEVDGNFFIN